MQPDLECQDPDNWDCYCLSCKRQMRAAWIDFRDFLIHALLVAFVIASCAAYCLHFKKLT